MAVVEMKNKEHPGTVVRVPASQVKNLERRGYQIIPSADHADEDSTVNQSSSEEIDNG